MIRWDVVMRGEVIRWDVVMRGEVIRWDVVFAAIASQSFS